jgi:heme/copper-type cytochrome/quinol oxidase subunit 4
MDWIKKRVWQLGIAIVLAVIAWWLMYAGGAGDQNQVLLWIGLILFFFAMLIPLISKVYLWAEEQQGEKGET